MVLQGHTVCKAVEAFIQYPLYPGSGIVLIHSLSSLVGQFSATAAYRINVQMASNKSIWAFKKKNVFQVSWDMNEN